MTGITMTLSSPTVELKDGKGSLTASVTNAGPDAERVVLGAFPGQQATPPSPTYTNVERPLRSIGAGATEQYVVSFDTNGTPPATPPASPGSHPVKLIAYSADDAPEDYADQAHLVTLVVPEAAKQKPRPGFPWLWVIIGAVALLAVIGGVIWFLLRDVNVPSVMGKPKAEAEQVLKDAGFSVYSSDMESAEAAGTVVGQVPEGDKPAPRGSAVNLDVAVPLKSTVPAVIGMSIVDAKAALTTAKIQLDFTQGSTCQANPGNFLLRCVVTGVNPDAGEKVNQNALVLVRTEVKQVGLIEPPINFCKINPSACIAINP